MQAGNPVLKGLGQQVDLFGGGRGVGAGDGEPITVVVAEVFVGGRVRVMAARRKAGSAVMSVPGTAAGNPMPILDSVLRA